MANYSCAAAELCKAQHVPVDSIHRCRKCKQYLHVFCVGVSETPPDFDAQNGLEYDCIKCCNGIAMGLFNCPPAPAVAPAVTCTLANNTSPQAVPTGLSNEGASATNDVGVAHPTSSSGSTSSAASNGEGTLRDTDSGPQIAVPTGICTEEEWISTIQEVYDEAGEASPSKRTYATRYPRLWKLVGKFVKAWKDAQWEHPMKCSNGTVFKQKVIRAIIKDRKYFRKNELPPVAKIKYDEMFPNFREVFYYPLSSFEAYAQAEWQHDLARIEREQKATGNDALRIIGIALRNENRDDLNLLNAGKTYFRKQVDGALSRNSSIFHRFKQQFNDTEIVLDTPDRAPMLTSYVEINLNAHDHIDISRDGDWLEDLYFSTMRDYRSAMVKWKQGTGGGSGAPENYADWNKRDDWTFAEYGGHKGDILSVIYMMDKDAGFPLLEIYDDAPASSTAEDGVAPSPTKRAKRAGPHERMALVGDKLCDAMTSGFQIMATAMKTIGENTRPVSNDSVDTVEDASIDVMHQINNGIETIHKIEEHLDDLRIRMNDARASNHRGELVSRSFRRRAKLFEEMLQRAEDELEELMASKDKVRNKKK